MPRDGQLEFKNFSSKMAKIHENITVTLFIGFSCFFIFSHVLYRYTDVVTSKIHDADSEYDNVSSGERGTLRKI